MLIEFHKTILEAEENFNKFSFLFNLCYINRRYDLFIDLDEVSDTVVYSQLRDADRELIEQYYLKVVNESQVPDFILLDKPKGSKCELSLDEAIALLNQPFQLILENSQNDRHFFEAIVRNFKKKGKKISTHLHHRWLIYGNAGGCTNVRNFLNEKINSFRDMPKDGAFYIRCFVLIDSDSEYPNDVKTSRQELARFLDTNGIPYHFLLKREMENYLPDEVFADVGGSDAFKSTYLALDPLQKDFIDIEYGLKARDLDDKKLPIGKLYVNLDTNARSNVRNKGLNMNNYKKEFPLFFNSAKVTQESLLKRTAHQGNMADELSDILDKINQFI